MKNTENKNIIIDQLSKKHEKSHQEVKKKMEEAILSGLGNPAPEVRAEWNRLFGEGHQPDMEEFIKNITDLLK